MKQVKLLILVLISSLFMLGTVQAGVYYEAEDYAPPVLPTDPGNSLGSWAVVSTGLARSGSRLTTTAQDTVAIPLTLALPAKPETIYNLSIQSNGGDAGGCNLDFSLDGGLTWDTTTFRETVGEWPVGQVATGSNGVVTVMISNIPFTSYDGCDYIKLEEVGPSINPLDEIKSLVQDVIDLLLTPQGRRTSGDKTWNDE